MQPRMTCPLPRQLEAFRDGTLSPAEETALCTHLDICPACRKYLDERTSADLFPTGMKPQAAPTGPYLEPALLQALARLRVQPEPPLSLGAIPAKDPEVPVASIHADDLCPTEELTPLERRFLEPSDNPKTLGRVGPYDVLRLVGRGGMGFVLKAHDPSLNRIVAIKMLAPRWPRMPWLAAASRVRRRPPRPSAMSTW